MIQHIWFRRLLRVARWFFSIRHLVSIWVPAALLIILYNAVPFYRDAEGLPSDPAAMRYLLVLNAATLLLSLHILYTPIFPNPRRLRGFVASALLYLWMTLPTVIVVTGIRDVLEGRAPPDPLVVYNSYYYGVTLGVLAVILTPPLVYVADTLLRGAWPRLEKIVVHAAYGFLVVIMQAALGAVVDATIYRLTGDLASLTIYMRGWSPGARSYMEEKGVAATLMITWGYLASIIMLGFATEKLYNLLTRRREGGGKEGEATGGGSQRAASEGEEAPPAP